MPLSPNDVLLDEVLRTLADRVRRLREERGLTVLELSFEAGLSESRVRAIEAGRTTASLATLVALAETFEVGIAALFGDSLRPTGEGTGEDPRSASVVPSEVMWGGALPPAPWLAEPAAPVSPYVVPSEVVWGGDLPAAPWTSAKAGPTMPDVSDGRPSSSWQRVPPAAVEAPETGADAGGALPPAPREHTWASRGVPVHEPHAVTGSAPRVAVPPVPDPPARWEVASSAPNAPARQNPPLARTHEQNPSSVRHPVDESSPYVVITSGPSTRRQPRTFADLREGALAGREFTSLRQFAIAAVAEGGFSAVAVARVFRLPAWRLEQWVSEAGYLHR